MGKLYIVGVGLAPDLITLRALRVLRHVRRVYIDSYTGFIDIENEVLSEVLKDKEVTFLSRRDVEDLSGKVIFEGVREGDVALLVAGDPLVATTHVSLILEAYNRGIKVEVIPGISVIPHALTLSGLMVYKLGKVATIVYPKEGIIYEYPYDVVKDNDARNLHSLLLLDLDVERGIAMKASEAIDILLMVEERRREGVIRLNRYGVVIAALGSNKQVICYDTLGTLKDLAISEVPQTLIITSPKLHFMEEEYLKVVNREYCR